MSPVTFEWVMAHTEMSQFTLNSLAGNRASSVTVVHMNASCQIWISRTFGGKKGMSHVTCGHGTHKRVMSDRIRCRVIHTNASCQIWIRHKCE